jgi:hypothetical protein
MSFPITDKMRARVIAALRANPNALQVARKIGRISYGSVWSIAKKEGIELTVGLAVIHGPKITAAKRARIVAALLETPNARKVARKVGGVSHVTVCAVAKSEDIKLGTGRKPGSGRKLGTSRPAKGPRR